MISRGGTLLPYIYADTRCIDAVIVSQVGANDLTLIQQTARSAFLLPAAATTAAATGDVNVSSAPANAGVDNHFLELGTNQPNA